MGIRIVLPDEVRVYVEAQVRAGAYSSIDEYLLALVRQDPKRKAQSETEVLLLEGINSDTQAYWRICGNCS